MKKYANMQIINRIYKDREGGREREMEREIGKKERQRGKGEGERE